MSLLNILVNIYNDNEPTIEQLKLIDKDGNNLLLFSIENIKKIGDAIISSSSMLIFNKEMFYNEVLNKLVDKLIYNENIDINHLNNKGENVLILLAKKCIYADSFLSVLDTLNINIFHRDFLGNSVLTYLAKCSNKKYYGNLAEKSPFDLFFLYLMEAETFDGINQLKRKENELFLKELLGILSKNRDEPKLKELISELEKNSSFVYSGNVENLIANYQGETPKPISQRLIYPRSSRAKTSMKTLGIIPKIHSSIINNFADFELDKSCFCSLHPLGQLLTPTYIPVTRYGKSSTYGFYGQTRIIGAGFTWYYLEPDSQFFLLSNKTFVSANKIHAFLNLFDKDKLNNYKSLNRYTAEFRFYKNISEILDRVLKDIREYQNTISFSNDELIELYSKLEEVVIDNNWTNYFRNIDTKEIYEKFEMGYLDYLDKIIGDLSRNNGYDALIMTRQPGNYGRLVSECLDVRPRKVSFDNIYTK